MNLLRLLVLIAAAVLSSLSANLASAGTIPQSPSLFNKQNQVHPANLMNPVTINSFNYPAAIDLHVEPETKERQDGTQPDEFHEKVKRDPLMANPPTIQLEVGTGMNKAVKTFKFEQLHLHRRAEHLASENLNHSYPMELHMVHKREPDPGNDPLPLNVAVGRWINVLIDPVGPGFDPDFGHNQDLENLFDVYGDYDPLDNEVEDLNLNKLLPAVADFQYYRYSGSLTAPQVEKPNETADVLVWDNLTGPPAVYNEKYLSDTPVEWVMFEKPLDISLAQWAQYTSFIFNYDNHFGAQYTREPFEHLFGVWKLTNDHADLRRRSRAGHDLAAGRGWRDRRAARRAAAFGRISRNALASGLFLVLIRGLAPGG
jgi:hypothetical protein